MKKVNLLIYMLVIMLTVIPIFFAKITDKAAAESRGLRIGLVGEIDPINPNDSINQNTENVYRQVFETLITADESMNLRPQLATSWKILPDGTAIIFNLRKGVKFHDGTNFDARAVKVTFERMVNEKLKRWSHFAPLLGSIEVVNEYAIKINLRGSPASALTLLSVRGHIESPFAIEKYGKKEIGFHPIGTGPFKFVEWVPDQRVVLEANKGYWGGEPQIAQLVFKPVPDDHSRVAMVEAGDLDVAIRPPYTEIQRLKSLAGVKIVEWRSGVIFFVAFNTAKAPFDDKRVRQAISYGIDRKGIVNTLLFGLAGLAETYAAPSMQNIFKYDIYPYSPEKAKSILSNLGWKLGKSGFLEKDGEIFKAALFTPSGRYPMDQQIAEAIQAQLKKIGIQLKINVLESGAFIKATMGDRQTKQNSEYGMYILSRPMGPDPDSAFYQHFHSSSAPPKGNNSAIFTNSDFDRAIEEATKTIDETKRDILFKKVQDILNEEIPWLPIYDWVDFLALRKGIKGVGPQNPFFHFFVSKEAQLEP